MKCCKIIVLIHYYRCIKPSHANGINDKYADHKFENDEFNIPSYYHLKVVMNNDINEIDEYAGHIRFTKLIIMMDSIFQASII